MAITVGPATRFKRRSSMRQALLAHVTTLAIGWHFAEALQLAASGGRRVYD